MKNKQITPYRQCELKRENQHLVSWIPKEYAIKGKYLKLKSQDGEWEDGWEVEYVGEKDMPENVLDFQSQDYKRTRKASDI
jgi:hypothetical protein